MPSSEQVRQYQQVTRNLAEDAGLALKRQLRAYLGENPGATAAEAREYAKGAAAGIVKEFSQASGVLAEQLYAAEFGSLPSGYIESVVNADAIDAAVRYRVCDLVDGDVDGFVEGMGEWAAQASFNACNTRTLQLARGKKSKAQTPRKRGARRKAGHTTWFARVPSGANTCTWCAMLAGRGYVYWTEETAGKFSKWHDNCRCTVVASTKKGGIEGYDPDEWLQRWMDYEEIDARAGLTRSQKAALKAAKSGSEGVFWTRADPALDYFGPAEDDDPDLLAQIKEDLEASGVKIKVNSRGDREKIAYGPSSTAGEPGNMDVTEDMSLSAWLHEYEHFRQDRDLGFPPSIYYYADNALRASMEEGAYGVEIERAAARGYNELVSQLQELLAEERSRLNGQGQD